MTDDGHGDIHGDGQGDERDPLLVRPFVLRDSRALDDDESTQTWPAAAGPSSPEEPGRADADAPTAVLHLPFRRKHAAAPARSAGRRRVAVLAGAAAVVVLGAAAAGYAALRDDVRPAVTTGLPGGPLPAATAPLTSSAATPTSPGTSPATVTGPGAGVETRTTSTGTATSTPPASATTSAPSVPSSSPSLGEPISLDPDPTDGGETSSPRAPEAIAPAPPSADRVGVIRGQNGICLDLNGAIAIDGQHIQVYDCNGTVAQTWTLATDGTLRVQGKCALAVGDDAVEIVSCDGRSTAQWRISGQRLINVATSTCLTDPASGRSSGTGVTVSTCGGSANQRWSLP